MNLSHSLFEKPRLRTGVTFSQAEQEILIAYRDQSCSLHYDDIIPSEIMSFLSTIQRETLTTAQLNSQYQQSLGNVNDLLRELDQLGLLDEGKGSSTDSCSTGADFYHIKLLPMVRNLQYKLSSSPFYIRMAEGNITRNELIGFAMEYYHLVKMAPSLIAPSLSHVVNEEANKQLIKLFIDEYNHDLMMLACLEAVGIQKKIMLKRQPLASTFSSYISLGVYSRQHLLSFFSALFLFETPSTEFNELFIDCCQKQNMPSGFYQPIIKHSDINEQESHGTITETLLKTIPVVSNEEQVTTLINIHALVEMLHKQDQEIISYYSHPTVDLYRIFS